MNVKPRIAAGIEDNLKFSFDKFFATYANPSLEPRHIIRNTTILVILSINTTDIKFVFINNLFEMNMSTTNVREDWGRLCNHIFRFCAISVIAKKHKLHVNYHLSKYKSIRDLGIILYSSDTKKEGSRPNLIDETMLELYNSNEKIGGLTNYHNKFFQTKSCADLIFEYIRSDESKKSIIDKNPYKDRYNNNNDCYVHVRLHDARRWNPGLSYYFQVLDDLKFDKLYISSDQPGDSIVQEIKKRYDNSEILTKSEIETIQFASTCKNVVLSHGTFSGIIGYLSFYSNVYYCKVELNGWHPMGVFDGKDELTSCKPGKWIGIINSETNDKFDKIICDRRRAREAAGNKYG